VTSNRIESFRLKRPDEIDRMRASGRILGAALAHLAASVRPGITTLELDREAETFIRDHRCIPGFLGYQGFTNSLCVSVNEEIVHGIPSGRRLKPGDIVGLDFGVVYQGFYGDAARTVPVGKITDRAERLLRITREALYAGIEQAQVGNRISDIARAVQQTAESAGFSVVTDFAGHGIGRSLHEDPQVPNYVRRGMPNPRLQEGMALAIEPMINEGVPELRILDDGWTAVTADGKLSAHFEHSIAITVGGPRILSEVANV